MFERTVSVIIPCYNAAPWITATIQSALDQPVAELEVIVVDDGSTDGSGDLVAQQFPQVRLVRTPNGGASRARNLGTSLAQGAFIQYLDADDLLAPGKLAAQLAALIQSGAEVAYGAWQRLRLGLDGNYQPAERIERTLSGDPAIRLFTDFWCPPAAYLFRRSIVERIGGWNERLPIIQDARFALDAALHGACFVATPGVMAYYRVHSSGSVSSGSQAAFYRDVYTNATEVEQVWLARGGLSAAQRAALLQVYGGVAYMGFDCDDGLFKAGYAAVQRLNHGQAPAHLRRLAVAHTIFGSQRVKQVVGQVRTMLAVGRTLVSR
ncbi:MAG: glycosyltransferase family 2 protein [Oscillochloridaceae bacterium umkhey_bin13]